MNSEIAKLAAMIYGEGASEDRATKVMMGSSALNRLEAKREKEFGGDLDTVLTKGYYAVSKKSPLYQQAIDQKFPDEVSENAWRESYAIASGLIKGTIERADGMFYFKDDEVKRQKKERSFDFKKVKEIGRTGQYNVYSY